MQSIINKEAIKLFKVLSEMEQTVLPLKFAYAVMRTKKGLQPVVDSFNELRKPPEDYTKYETKRVEICQKYAKKVEGLDEPLIEDGKYTIDEANATVLKEAMEALQREYEPLFKEMEDKSNGISSLLDESSDVEIFTVDIEFLPKEITPEKLEIISCMIRE